MTVCHPTSEQLGTYDECCQATRALIGVPFKLTSTPCTCTDANSHPQLAYASPIPLVGYYPRSPSRPLKNIGPLRHRKMRAVIGIPHLVLSVASALCGVDGRVDQARCHAAVG
eukprot:scaffold127208_cov31-Tisochrysis_lutea.AAC.1